jgi:general secretion pathway protein C
MQAIAFKIPSFLPIMIVSLATIAAIAVLGMVLAYWTWAFFSPHSEARSQPAQTATSAGNGVEAANRLFGNALQGSGGAAAIGISYRLLGVVAAPGTRSGYAVLRLDGKRTVAVREGGEIEPGVRILEVHPDHVVLERNGQRETLAWVVQGKAAGLGLPAPRN